MTKRTDRELVEEAQSGDRDAIGELFSRYWRAMRAVAFGVTGEFASAEDVAATAFQHALVEIASLRDPDRFGPWLRTIVVRTARLARPRRLANIDDVDPPTGNPSPDAALEQIQIGYVIHQATRALPAAMREAVALVYFEGYDADSAAEFLGIPAGTLRRRLHDGRTRLRIEVEQILNGSTRMHEQREREIEKLKNLLDKGDIYEGLRGTVALRPPPAELMDMFLRRESAPALDAQFVAALAQPSVRALDPTHALGSVAAAIRRALPEFETWEFDVNEAATRFFKGERSTMPRGARIRATRALIRIVANGSVQSMYEHLHNSPNPESFSAAKDDLRSSDVLDLTWTANAALELRSVQALLEQVVATVLPHAAIRFSPYDEPRYRAALQLHLSDIPARAACGGVLNEWPEAAHLRIFLEPWATLRSGQLIDFEPAPFAP